MKSLPTILLLVAVLGGAFMIFQSSNTQSTLQTNESSPNTAQSTAKPIACNGRPIPQQIEGPYYKEGSPRTTNFYDERIPGEKVTLTGYVLDTDCKPIANAWIDFWQANGNGDYDNEGYGLRGHQYTDDQGKFTLTTVIPGEYPGRTPHIHFKIRASENNEIITSQLYLPNAERNSTDAIFDDELVMTIQNGPDGKVASYNIVIDR